MKTDDTKERLLAYIKKSREGQKPKKAVYLIGRDRILSELLHRKQQQLN